LCPVTCTACWWDMSPFFPISSPINVEFIGILLTLSD
jgi:hypothetical protein